MLCALGKGRGGETSCEEEREQGEKGRRLSVPVSNEKGVVESEGAERRERGFLFCFLLFTLFFRTQSIPLCFLPSPGLARASVKLRFRRPSEHKLSLDRETKLT